MIFHYIQYKNLFSTYIVNPIYVDLEQRVFALVFPDPNTRTTIAFEHTDLIPYECDFTRFDKITIRRSALFTSFSYTICGSDRIHTYKIPETLSIDKIFEIVQTLG